MTTSVSTEIATDRELRPEFAPFLGLMDFLGALLGPRSEIVLHDTSDLSRSVVALTHGHVSGRSVGAPATDLVLKVLRNQRDGDDFLANYEAESATGRGFRSSTYFIRDEAGAVIGMLCINIDDTDLVLARRALEAITATTNIMKGDGYSEKLSITVDDLTLDSVSRIVSAQPVPPARMMPGEKVDAVRDLDKAGVFLLKGSVARAAAVLQISEPTVYRYLRQVRQEA
ncbi:helix-turn-helix transcriptional regulator [Herbiconiux solani]|uniref:helix-turn-helix transcriptional regulator n=1 Tax=Herbiconiux solani TaxID=661329 RepID=UPI0008250C93|nr:PAS domain-containing protein [Herbiconiux solani]